MPARKCIKRISRTRRLTIPRYGETGTIVVALWGNLFELKHLGPKELKGITEPVTAFEVLRASSIESRFEAMHPGA
jgi:hypothetical protein